VLGHHLAGLGESLADRAKDLFRVVVELPQGAAMSGTSTRSSYAPVTIVQDVASTAAANASPLAAAFPADDQVDTGLAWQYRSVARALQADAVPDPDLARVARADMPELAAGDSKSALGLTQPNSNYGHVRDDTRWRWPPRPVEKHVCRARRECVAIEFQLLACPAEGEVGQPSALKSATARQSW
jgi:hypothetical protein